ncbi:MAG TPA: hypothetical protein VN023_10315, partial [Methylovorus sp.]|nr:hypothetical protein [Methylovorus sp.]
FDKKNWLSKIALIAPMKKIRPEVRNMVAGSNAKNENIASNLAGQTFMTVLTHYGLHLPVKNPRLMIDLLNQSVNSKF